MKTKNHDNELYKIISSHERLLITVVVMVATLMQMIDTTIVNVALPYMQGALNTTADGITWTLTSYLVASAIFMPLTGYLADRLGRRNYLTLSIIGFTIASALCGAAPNIGQLVFFRLMQGIFGAGLVPLSQAILTDIFSPKDRGKAMAIWGMGVMVGPVLGPTLGGYLTEYASWRWTFYVNIPIGIFTLILINVIPETPKKSRTMDWFGLGLISTFIASLQYLLDRGNQEDWFNSRLICLIAYIGISALFLFILHNIKRVQKSVFDLRIFQDRNFAISSILLGCLGLGLYGLMVLNPLMIEGLLNYPALTTGLIMAPRGISSIVSMLIVSRLINQLDIRLIILAGIIISIVGIALSTNYSLTSFSPFWLILPMVIQGLGLGMIFVALSTLAYSTLPQELRTEAAGLFSLLRTLGGSIGISIAITLLTRYNQVFWHHLSSFINVFNPALSQYANALNLKITQPLAILLLQKQLQQQAAMLAYINVFAAIMWCFVIMIPLLLLLHPAKVKQTSIIQTE